MTENCRVNDCQKRLLIAALEQIAGLAPEERVIPLDRAFATVREMASIARNELSHHARVSSPKDPS